MLTCECRFIAGLRAIGTLRRIVTSDPLGHRGDRLNKLRSLAVDNSWDSRPALDLGDTLAGTLKKNSFREIPHVELPCRRPPLAHSGIPFLGLGIPWREGKRHGSVGV